MGASFVLSSAKKDLVRRARDPLALLLWVGIPLAIGGLILLATGGQGGPQPRAKVLLVDLDGSFLSKMLRGGLDGGEAPFDVELVGLEEGRARIDEGEASALVVLPEGFAQALFEEEPATVEVVTNPAQRILPGLVEEALAILSEAVFYAHRLLGEDLREMAVGPEDGASTFPDARVAEISVAINRKMRALEDVLFPPVIRLETSGPEGDGEEAGEKTPLSLAALFFPSMLFMALFFIAQGLSDDVWREHALGTLRRVVTTPPATGPFLVGKLLAGAAVILLVCLVALVLGAFALDLAAPRLLPALAWAVATGAVLLLLMVLIQLHATSQRGGNLLTNTILFPLIMLGGSFFPFEAMPGWMAAIGRRTPNGWALVEFKAILFGAVEPARLAASAAGLVAAGVLLFWLCDRRLRRRFAAMP